MATNYKVLGQRSPTSSNTYEDLYTVPSATATVCSTLSICNRGISATFRIAIRPAGASLLDKHFIIYDNTLSPNDTVFLTLGITLSASDVVTIYSSETTVSFSLFGSEIS